MNSSPNTFIHLHVHSEYSLADGLCRIPELVDRAVELNMPALALTERDNFFSVIKFYRKALAKGVKPILGIDCLLKISNDTVPVPTIILCQDADGYEGLNNAILHAQLAPRVDNRPVIDLCYLNQQTQQLIFLFHTWAIEFTSQLQENENSLNKYDHFLSSNEGRIYWAVRNISDERNETMRPLISHLASVNRIPLVAVNDVRFIYETDYDAHEARVCIHDSRIIADPRRPKRYTRSQYFRGATEMATVFRDHPELVANTVQIARRCNVVMDLESVHMPEYVHPKQHVDDRADGTTKASHLESSTDPKQSLDVQSFFRDQAKLGLEQRLLENQKKASSPSFEITDQEYFGRLEMEMVVIERMGYQGYFLIVADFIKWARENDIPVGPGRGSGAGSLVAYALRITNLDPLEHELLFERFLNPERVSLPDFDIDFCVDGRDRVIEYVSKRYNGEGENDLRVSQIITFGTLASRAVVRDVGRVLGYPYPFVDKVAKLISSEIGITLEDALKDPTLKERYEQEQDVRAIFDLALKLEGIARNAGKHAGGVIIAPKALTHFMPLYIEPGGQSVVSQFDMKDVEGIGLVKFDFLGLRTLTAIDIACKNIDALTDDEGAKFDIESISLTDPKTYQLIQHTTTNAVFQLESRGMRELIKRLKPDTFDDVVALVALFRPGPLQSGMVDDFIDRKHGRTQVAYPHQSLASILKPTYGVILYQEQVMQIAQQLSGFSLGSADLLRRAMGKKLPEEMQRVRQQFVDGAVANGVSEIVAGGIFDLIEKFAGYGFNKSHSVAYALIAYQTAYLKANYRAPFMAAVMTTELSRSERLAVLIRDCRRSGIEVKIPDINESEKTFVAKDKSTIRYGLGAIRGVGDSAVDAILIALEHEHAKFADLFDFCATVDLRKVTRKVIETLIYAGAMDAFSVSRSRLFANIATAMNYGEQSQQQAASGQNDMFSTASSQLHKPKLKNARIWTDSYLLAKEKQTLGIYFSGHPIHPYQKELFEFITGQIATLKSDKYRLQTAAGFIQSIRYINTRSGRMANLVLDDESGRLDVLLRDELLKSQPQLVETDNLIIVQGKIKDDDFSGGISMAAVNISDIASKRCELNQSLNIYLDEANLQNGAIAEIQSILRPYLGGGLPICIQYCSKHAQGKLWFGESHRVYPQDELLANLRGIFGTENVCLEN